VAGNGDPGVQLDAVEYGNDGLVIAAIPAGTVDLKRNWKEPTWRIAVDHDFSDDIMGYVSYTRGFKSGSLNPGSISNAQVPVDPEIIDAYEVGLKTELFDRRLRLNLSAFYYDYRNIQVSAVTPQGTSRTENAASARLYGLDIDLQARPTQELMIRAGLNLLDSKYESYASAQATLPQVQGVTCSATPQQVTIEEARAIAAGTPTGGNCAYSLDASGSDLIIAPKLAANFGFDYDLMLAGESRVRLSSTLYYNDGFDTAPGGILAHVGSFENLTASLSWHAPDDRYFVRIWGDNLTNNRHPEVILPLGVAYQEVANKPTTYGATVGFRFGS